MSPGGKGGTPLPLAVRLRRTRKQGGAEGEHPFETLFHSIYTSFLYYRLSSINFATNFKPKTPRKFLLTRSSWFK